MTKQDLRDINKYKWEDFLINETVGIEKLCRLLGVKFDNSPTT